MTYIPTTKRQGLTLIEVLVAIFIMGIGTIAILTLFPLGVLRMADAIKDERSSNAVANAKAIANLLDIRHDSTIQNAMTNPGGGLAAADPNGPSYPVFIDPIGFRSSLPPSDQWVGGVTDSIPRTSAGVANNDANTLRFFSFLDDLSFDKIGKPEVIAPGPPPSIERDIQYSWGFLCQRPKTSDDSVVEMTVVVYNQRSTFLDANQGKVNLTLPEFIYDNAVFDLDERLIELQHGALEEAPVKPGQWILDATHVRDGGGNIRSMHGFFYRVTEVTSGGTGISQVSVAGELRGFGTRTGRVNNCRAIILEGVSEVFELGAGRLP